MQLSPENAGTWLVGVAGVSPDAQRPFENPQLLAGVHGKLLHVRHGVTASREADIGVTGVARHGDIQGLSVEKYRRAVDVLYLGAVEVQRLPRPDNIRNDQVGRWGYMPSEAENDLRHIGAGQQHGKRCDGAVRKRFLNGFGSLRRTVNGLQSLDGIADVGV